MATDNSTRFWNLQDQKLSQHINAKKQPPDLSSSIACDVNYTNNLPNELNSSILLACYFIVVTLASICSCVVHS